MRSILKSLTARTSGVLEAIDELRCAVGAAEARAAGQIIKDDGNAAQQIADFLQRYQLL